MVAFGEIIFTFRTDGLESHFDQIKTKYLKEKRKKIKTFAGFKSLKLFYRKNYVSDDNKYNVN